MPNLLSGSKLRTGGSGQFIKLQDAMPQLPQSPTTSTGYTIVTSDKLVSTYASSLGNIEFNGGEVYSNISTQTLTLIGTGTTAVVIRADAPVSSTSTLVVQGGAGINGDMFVGGSFNAATSTFVTLKVTSLETSTNPFTGALQVVGGAGIGENLNVFGTLHVANTATFSTDLNVGQSVLIDGELNVVGTGGVTLSPQAASINLQPTLGGTILIQPSLTGHIDDMFIGLYVPRDGYFTTVHSNDSTVSNTLYVGGVSTLHSVTATSAVFTDTVNANTNLIANTATVTTNLTANQSIYSQDGIAEYHNLLYTPKVTISTSAPLNPRVGDFWINPTYGAECQYVNDGGNHIWIQFTGF